MKTIIEDTDFRVKYEFREGEQTRVLTFIKTEPNQSFEKQAEDKYAAWIKWLQEQPQ